MAPEKAKRDRQTYRRTTDCFAGATIIRIDIRNKFSTDIEIYIGEKKGRDLTQSHDKSPSTNRNVKRAK